MGRRRSPIIKHRHQHEQPELVAAPIEAFPNDVGNTSLVKAAIGNYNSRSGTNRLNRSSPWNDSYAKSKNHSTSKVKQIFSKPILLLTIASMAFCGIFINVLQLLLCLTVHLSDSKRWQTIHRRAMSYLMYTLFAPFVTLLYYWSNAKFTMTVGDSKLFNLQNQEFVSIILPNHSYELDYMINFVLADQINCSYDCLKIMSKDEVKYVPILGWSLWMGGMIFLKRDWNQDEATLDTKLAQLTYESKILLAIYPEGTRWTEERQEAAFKFAESKGREPLKHHLIPRSRGFVHTVRHFLLHEGARTKQFRVFNLENVMQDKLRFQDFMNGRQLKVHTYCEEVILSDEIREEVRTSKSSEDCPKLAQLLQDVFKRKDKLIDEFIANGYRFPVPRTGGNHPFRRPKLPLIIGVLVTCFSFGTISYLAATTFANSIAFWSLIMGFSIGSNCLLNRIAKESHVASMKTKRKSEGKQAG